MFFLLLLIVSFVSALNIEANFKPDSVSIINNYDEPAVFDFYVKNNDSDVTLQFFTYERFRIEPDNFTLSKGASKNINVKFYAFDFMRNNVGYISMPVYIRNIQNPEDFYKIDKLIIKLVNLNNAFEIESENINPQSNFGKIYIQSLENINYSNINLMINSVFSDSKKEILNLKPYEKKEIIFPLDQEKMKELLAGEYNVELFFTVNGQTNSFKVPVKLLEKSGLSVKEFSKGFIIQELSIEKLNEGNIMSVADISIKKNIISRFFTTFSSEPDRVERKGLFVYYSWQKELRPNQSLKVNIKTNFIFPFIILILMIIISILVKLLFRQDVIVKKRVGFVKTKSNDFALKVTISVKTRKFIEHIKIFDRIPAIAKLYENFGDPKPIIRENGRLEWTLDRLSEGEERVFSYIFYSKINVVGKFELPPVTVLFEKEGKPKEINSNRVFFINEPKKDY